MRKRRQQPIRPVRDESAVEGKDKAMRGHNTSRRLDRPGSAFVATDSRASEPRSASIHVLNSSPRPGEHRSAVRSTPMPPALRNEMAELLVEVVVSSLVVAFFV